MDAKNILVSNLDVEAYKAALAVPEALRALGIARNRADKISCPVHREQNPSCHVYEDHLYCFGCHTYLDVIDLVRSVKGCGFWEALDWIAELKGMPKPTRNPAIQQHHEAARRISDTYFAVFQDALKNSETALQYLENRGISREVMSGRCGFLPPNYWPGDREAAKRAGLLSSEGNFLFAGRVIVPISWQGRMVAFYGRALDDSRGPRHMYPAVTDPPMPPPIWNLDRCKLEPEIVLCEAVIDGLTLMCHDYEAVSSLRGTTGLTDDALRLINATRIRKVIVAFDSDRNEAGQRTALNVGEKLFRAGLEVEIVTLPLDDHETKTDVNSFFQAHGPAAFLSIPHQDFFSYALSRIPSEGSPREKYAALGPILDLVSEQQPVMWGEYVNLIHERFPGLDRRRVMGEISRRKKQTSPAWQMGDKFRPVAIAEQIKGRAPLFSNAHQIYRYDEGLYRLWVPELINQEVISLIGPDTQAHHLDAVRTVLASLTYRDSHEINKPGILNLQNCLLDVTSGKTSDHTHEVLSTIRVEVAYDPGATCPLWVKTLEEILPDAAARELLAQIFGYSLTANTSYQKGFVLYGEGANGKSVVLDVLEALVGTDNCSALEVGDLKDKFRPAELLDKLVNIASEVPSATAIHDARFKKVITGEAITAERKQGHPFKFRPCAKWIIACNNLPLTRDKTYGYFRRFIILKFTVRIPPEKADRNRAERIIKSELSGVLNWALMGHKTLIERNGFTLPQSSIDALEEYRRDSEPLLDFIDTHIMVAQGRGEFLKHVHREHKRWADETGNKTLTDRTLSKDLVKNLPIKAGYRNGYAYLYGITLKSSQVDER